MPTLDHTGTICAFAWASLEIDAKGETRPCCQYQGVLTDAQGRPFNVGTDAIKDIVECQEFKNIRSEMLAGTIPQGCQQCWQDQRAGRDTRNNANANIHLDSKALDEHSQPLQFMGIALGTTCNLRCRICGPWASSVWASDEIRMRGKSTTAREKQLLVQGAWPINSPHFWQDFENQLETLTHINFYGGEPFMSPRHLDLLQNLAQRDRAKDLTITYSTNGTIFPESMKDQGQHFKKVHVQFSIDDLRQRFEYQRKNAVWNEVVSNIDRFAELKGLSKSIICAVSMFNILYLSEILEYFDQRWPEIPVTTTVVYHHYYNSMLYAPERLKKEAIRRLQSRSYLEKTQQQVEQVIATMNQNPSNEQYWKEFQARVVELDRFRQESIATDHGDLYRFFDIYSQ
jgi:MoaA/NifB/PqqE/SkfB family radical SAM enzyme